MAGVEEGVAPVVVETVVEEAPEVSVCNEEIEAPVASEHKRKHEELEMRMEDKAEGTEEAVVVASEVDGDVTNLERNVEEKAIENVEVNGDGKDDAGDAKRQKVDTVEDDSALGGIKEEKEKEEANVSENGTASFVDDLQKSPSEELEKSDVLVSEQGDIPSAGYNEASEQPAESRKIEVPNNKVGVLIGKSGETIRYLQYNSGAKIQITRDVDADRSAPTREVELIGSLECINKAEQLIKDVIAEADAGGSPALVARGFGTAQSGAEQLEIQVPNEKVGLIIGKGGDTIKSLQTRSGARIQLIPQHLPEGDTSKVRIVRISGNKKQIETATEMIQEVMNQLPGRPSSFSGGYNQQAYRPRGPVPSQWGPRAMHPTPTGGYDHQQRGMYPTQIQYPPSYGGYQQPPPRGGYGGGWDHRPLSHGPGQGGGYDYYGGPPPDSQPSGHLSAHTTAPTSAAGSYYGQPQGAGYGQPGPYAQSMPSQQSYGQGYAEPKYDGQAPNQHMYGQQPLSSQPGPYSQMPQSGYQQPYNRPVYGGAPSQVPPQSYGQTQPPVYAQGSTAPGYGSGGQSQQPYPYGAGQLAPTYTQQYGAPVSGGDGYMQQPSTGYAQQTAPNAAGYAQQAAPTAAGYAQTAPAPAAYPQAVAATGAYAQYPQTSYGEQPAAAGSVPGYGYQAVPTDPAYGNTTPATAAGTAQTAYAQTPANPAGYDQSAPPQSAPPQSAYGSYPGGAPASYT